MLVGHPCFHWCVIHNVQALEDDWANVDKLMAVTPDLMLAGRAYTPPVIPPSRLVAGGAGGTTAMAAGAGQGTPAASGGGQAASGSGKPGPQGPQVFKLGSGNGRTGGPQQPAGEEMVDLVYDPVLNCYYDHKTNRYFELKH
jgi:ABC-type Fe3+-hydroxamate transport system substrate-binding protein